MQYLLSIVDKLKPLSNDIIIFILLPMKHIV